MKFFYISIATTATNKFFGGVFMEGEDDSDALARAIQANLMPGDGHEARVIEITEMPPDKYRHRVLSEEDLFELDKLDYN